MTTRRKTYVAMLVALVCGCVAAVQLAAHHGAENFYDITKPFTLKGVVNDFVRVNPHAFILIDVKDAKGEVQTWAVEGLPPNALIRGGWNPLALKKGEAISVTVFPPKPGVNLAGTLVIPKAAPEVVAQMEKVAEREKQQFLVHGTEVTFADGSKRLFGHASGYWSMK